MMKFYNLNLGFNKIFLLVAPSDYKPNKIGTAYKVFRVKNGKLYPPMVANPGGADTPVGVWLTADLGLFAGLSKTGRPQVKSTQSSTLSYRPGWHLGDIPRASQFDRTNKLTGLKLFPKDFVWALCLYTMDVDYQQLSDLQGYMRTRSDGTTYRSDKYQHSLAGLPKLPKDGYYKYRTNPRPDTVPWVITGAIKVKKLLSDLLVNKILLQNGVQPIHRQGGDKTLALLGLSNIRLSYSKRLKLSNAREYSDILLDMVELGILDKDNVILAFVKWLSLDDIRQFMRENLFYLLLYEDLLLKDLLLEDQ